MHASSPIVNDRVKKNCVAVKNAVTNKTRDIDANLEVKI
jgi:hypothetical protein